MPSQTSIAYQKIKDMIFHMEILPGDKISEPQISAKLEISRTPIHDALRKLGSEGLVEIGRNRGATVMKFTAAEIEEIGTIRLSQDILAGKLAAYHGSIADFDRLDQLAADCEETAAKGDTYNRIKADNDFHLEIAKISDNHYLYQQQYQIYQQVYLIQISKYTDIEASLKQIHHHLPLVQAIRNSDLETITDISCEHIKDFYHLDAYTMKCVGRQEDAQHNLRAAL